MLSDDELDEYVSSLLTNQAEKQAAAYSTLGFRAFLRNAGNEGPVGKPNTRFLRNIVKNVDGFNAALSRKEERESRERLRELKRREGDKMHAFKDEDRRSRNHEEDWRSRRRRERSQSPARREHSRDRDRRRRSRRDYSSDEDGRESGHGRPSEKRSRAASHDRPSRRHRDRRPRDSDDETERRQHRKRSDDRSPSRRRHREHQHRDGRRSPRKNSDDDNKDHRDSKGDVRRSSRHSRPREHRRHHHNIRKESPDNTSNDNCPRKATVKVVSHPDSPSSSIGPTEPTQGPEYLRSKGRGKMNGGTLDAKFSATYDPRKDVADTHDNSDDNILDDSDDWGVALRALRARQSYVLSGAMTERLSETQTQSQSNAWPTYSSGEREWDKGKVLLDDGSVGQTVWGVKKQI